MTEKKPFSVSYFLEEKMNKKLAADPSSVEDFQCVYQFDIDKDSWNLDLTSSAPQIQKGKHADPDCTIVISADNFEKLVRGNLNAPLALLTGKLKIKGEKSLALKLAELFS